MMMMTMTIARMKQHLLKVLLFLILIKAGVSKPTTDKVLEANIEANVNEITNEELDERSKYAEKMISYMNQTIDPCEDFYEYACGNWKNVIEERQAQNKRSNLVDIAYYLGDITEKLLQQSIDDLQLVNYTQEFKLAQQFYQSCMTADLHPLHKSQSYLDVIKSIGGFPAVDATWNETAFSWFNMSAHLTNYDAGGLINEEIVPEYPFLPYFKLPELGFELIVHSDNIASNTSRGYVLNERRMRKYLLAYGVEESKATQVINEIFEFWREVVAVADEFEDDQSKCEQLSLLSETNIFADWGYQFDIAWSGNDFNATNESCPCVYFYMQLDRICNEHKVAVANYLAMQFLYKMDARLTDKKYQKEYCALNIQRSFTYLMDELYLAAYFNEELHNEVAHIIEELRKSLRDVLEQADWLDETTRKEALLKESTIVTRIGHFQAPEMKERLIREMNTLTFIEDDYAQNNINLKKFRTRMRRYNGLHYEELNSTTKPLELLIGMQVNGFYYNIDNSINVMAGILHPPAYHKSWPNALKFGTLGYLIGHEFTHGFDSVGSRYDSTGDERYWWSNKSGKVFNERVNCYIDHYNSYLVPEINRNINGNQTKDENIADNGGLREALSAYRRNMKELSHIDASVKEEQMPGLNLTPEQLFFVGFAQLWCASYKEEHYWEELSNDHTMDKYRVLGAVTNLEDFAKIYKCPLGSKMNPNQEKCRVW